MRSVAILQFLKPFTRFFERKMAFMFYFLDRYLTPLAIIVLIICGALYFFFTSYLFRYTQWNYWLWKKRALAKTIYFGMVLGVLKILTGVM